MMGICGSLRKDSWNMKLLQQVMARVSAKGVETELYDLNGVPMFNPDTETDTPVEVTDLRYAVALADAVVIACPEHNCSMTAALKNAIEWLSRGENSIRGKVFYVIGTSPGRSGCMRMHMHATYSLESEGGIVLHQPRVLLPQVETYMDGDGNIQNEGISDLLDLATEGLYEFTGRVGA